jgi:hypothetical protein
MYRYDVFILIVKRINISITLNSYFYVEHLQSTQAANFKYIIHYK